MNNHPYRDAMLKLSFSSDLEERTIAMLKAASAESQKEEPTMKETTMKETQKESEIQTAETHTCKPTRHKSFHSSRKRFAIGGSILAAAACLLLVILPMLRAYEPDRIPADVNILRDEEPQINTVAAALGPLKTSAPMNEAYEADVIVSEAGVIAPEANGAVDWSGWDFEVPGDGAGSTAMEAGAWSSPADAWNTEEYSFIAENRFLSTLTSPLSTFAADVDTASYSKLRSAILAGQVVPADSVRVEEMLNYFSYSYARPQNGEPFGVTTEIADCPWNADTKLLLIGLQAEKIPEDSIPLQNLVFLIDVSGSMDEQGKLPLVQRSFLLLLEELKPTDTVSIVTYASGDRIVLDGVRASDKTKIMAAINELTAGGGTAGAAGIQTAYELAEKHFIKGGNNRVILATDGDLNIGISDEGSLTRLIEEKRESGVSLSVLGFGYGNYKDNKLEALADHGNGNYFYIDNIYEARKALVEDMGGTFLTVAKDVKLQVDFNPAKVNGYRLIGYENRVMAAEDFADDQKDGGEVGSGHRVTVLYELVPADSAMQVDAVESQYKSGTVSNSSDWLTLNIRCKAPEGDTSVLYQYPVNENAQMETMSDNLRFASAVAEVGMLLRDSEFKANASYESALERLRGTASIRGDVYKEEFQYLVTLLERDKQ